jgi:hypothetical protein
MQEGFGLMFKVSGRKRITFGENLFKKKYASSADNNTYL